MPEKRPSAASLRSRRSRGERPKSSARSSSYDGAPLEPSDAPHRANSSSRPAVRSRVGAPSDDEFPTGKFRKVSRDGAGSRMRSTGAHRRVLERPALGRLSPGEAGYANTAGLHPENSLRGGIPKPRGLRSSWPLAIAATIAVTGSLLFVAWAKMQTVQYTYEIDALIDTEEELAGRQRALRSELAQLRSAARLHELAPNLGLAPPEPGHVVVITGDPEGLNAALAADDSPSEGRTSDNLAGSSEPGEGPADRAPVESKSRRVEGQR